MPLPIFQVDAFAETPFTGNPAGVCLLDTPCDDRWMQAVAREMNLSETAFLLREADGFRLRWFTPAVEVDLCGHATLASAHVMWEKGILADDEPARFFTRSAVLTATRRGDLIEMDFPANAEKPADPPERLVEALGITPRYLGRNAFDYLALLAARTLSARLRPISQASARWRLAA